MDCWFELSNNPPVGTIYSELESRTRLQGPETSMEGSSTASACERVLGSEDIFCPTLLVLLCMNGRSRVAGVIIQVAIFDK